MKTENLIPATQYLHLVQKAIAHYNAANGRFCGWDKIAIWLDGAMRTTGGICRFSPSAGRCLIGLNKKLFETLDDDARFEVVAHEMGHAVCALSGKIQGHNYEWECAVRLLGGHPKRCHNHEVKHNLVRRFVVLDIAKNDITVFKPALYKKLKWLWTTGHPTGATFAPVGCVAVDRNTRTYRWEACQNPAWKDKKFLKGDWKMVA